MSRVMFHLMFLDKVVELFGGGSTINGATPSSLTPSMSLILLVAPESGFGRKMVPPSYNTSAGAKRHSFKDSTRKIPFHSPSSSD